MNKWSNKEIAEKMEWEGLGDMIQSYLSADNIQDKWLSAKWKQCADLMNEISEYLEKYLEEK